ncbi:MAG: CotH kinase family protein [Ruminococcus sp.]|nr:CotH kinase family protein [Ruminococcus sp.]
MKLSTRFTAAVLSCALTAAVLPSDMMDTVCAAEPAVCINEVCSQNKACLADSYGAYSDWIELYNPGSKAVDLSGWGLSDDTAKPLFFTFPSGTVIEAGGHMVVFASKQQSTAAELHTGFALSKNGDTVVLSDPSGSILQQIELPTLGNDVTYGRTPDGGDKFEIMSPTPAKANNVTVSAPGFSAPSGFYGTDFSLMLSADANETIYYTTDGSDPLTSSTAQVYTSAITVKDRTNEPNIYSSCEENDSSDTSVSRGTGYRKPTFNVDKATVVRAAAKNADGAFSRVVSQTYFVTSGDLAQYRNMTVVSIVADPADLFDAEKGIYVTGKQYLAWRSSSSYDPQKSVWDTDNICNYFSHGREWEREADITIFRSGENVVEQRMGIRIKGASTRNAAQKSFHLYARSDYGASKLEYPVIPGNYDWTGSLIDKYDSISLRAVGEEGRLRDGFAQKLVAGRENLTTQDMQSCVVFLNGEYWGLYEIVEKLSDYFIESNYGIDKKGVAMIKNGELEEGSQQEFDGFMDFCDEYAVLDLTDDTNYRAVCNVVDIDSLIDHYAAGLYLGTYDWPNYNYALWRNTGKVIEGNPYSDGKWRFISFDYDYTMGKTYADFGGVEGYAYDSFRHMEYFDDGGQYAPTNLFINLLKNKDFRTRFVNVYCDYANEVLTPEKVDAMISVYSRDYTEPLAQTTVRWWGFFGGSKDINLSYNRSQYTNQTLPQIKEFFRQRKGYTLEDMRSYLGLSPSMNTITLNTSGNGSIRINSITPDASGSWSGEYSADCPVTLTAVPDEGYDFTGWGGDISGSELTVTVTLDKAKSVTAGFSEHKTVRGDVNADGAFGAADLVLLQKWLLGVQGTELRDWKAADLSGDGVLNIFDLCMMRQELAAQG